MASYKKFEIYASSVLNTDEATENENGAGSQRVQIKLAELKVERFASYFFGRIVKRGYI